MFETPATPSITMTSPGSARLCASNSAILLTFARAASYGCSRNAMLRTVNAGPTMHAPAIVGLNWLAGSTPVMPSSSMMSDRMPLASPSDRKPAIRSGSGLGSAVMRMRSGAIFPVSFRSAIAFLSGCAESCLSDSLPALATCPSWTDVPPPTPIEPTIFPSTTIGRPPSSGMAPRSAR